MLSFAVSKLGCIELFVGCESGRQTLPRGFAEEAAMLPVMHRIAGDNRPIRVSAAQRTGSLRGSLVYFVLARQISCCSKRHHNLSPSICGLLTIRN